MARNILGHLPLDITCSLKLPVFLELRKTVRFLKHKLSKDKYPSIFFKSKVGNFVNYPSNNFGNTRDLKIEEYHWDIPQF